MKPLPLVHGPPALTDAEAAAMQRAAQAVRRQAVANMAQRPREEAVVQQTIWLHQATDAEMASAQADGLKVACQPGCKHCCAARVEALAPEVFLIADQIQQLAPKDKAALVDRLRAHAAATQKIAQDAAHDITQNTTQNTTQDATQDATQDTTPWSQRPTCPLLVNSLCSVYAVRPAVCRKAHSLDVKACEAGAPQIPQSLRVVVTAQARSQGTSDAFRDVGLVSSRHELASALLLALTDSTAQSRWLAGDAVFAQAVAL